MKASICIFTFTLLFFIEIDFVSPDVTLWEHWFNQPNPGRKLVLPVPKPGECVNLEPLQFSNILTSAQTTECVKLWENPDCTGKSMDLNPPDDKGQISSSFHEITSAIASCKPPPPPPSPKKKGKGGGKKKIVKKKKITVLG